MMTSSYDALTEQTRELALLDGAGPRRSRRRTADAGMVLGVLGGLVVAALAALL